LKPFWCGIGTEREARPKSLRSRVKDEVFLGSKPKELERLFRQGGRLGRLPLRSFVIISQREAGAAGGVSEAQHFPHFHLFGSLWGRVGHAD